MDRHGEDERFAAGDTVVLRYFHRGLPAGAIPTRVIALEGPVLWLPDGTRLAWPGVDGRHIREVPLEEKLTRPLAPVEGEWRDGGNLIVGRPGRAHSLWLFWGEERFTGWYVQLEAAWRPSPLGFDSEDHLLDLWIDADGSWHWKDEHELALAVELGAVTPEHAAAVRGEGERVLAEWPLPTGWEEWRPDPEWPLPELPAGWPAA